MSLKWDELSKAGYAILSRIYKEMDEAARTALKTDSGRTYEEPKSAVTGYGCYHIWRTEKGFQFDTRVCTYCGLRERI